jgi:type II secretory pathway predicted ATPase ExeA
LDEGFYRQNPPEVIALHLVHALRRKGIRLVIVDEAGLLSIDAIRGITLVRNTAENEGWILTIVFVGMDDLPSKMIRNEHIHKRVLEWCMFEPFSLDETWALLEKLHPYFANLDGRKQAHQKLVKFIHNISGGLPGLMVSFVEKLRYRLNTSEEEITVEFLQAIFNVTQESMINSLNRSKESYKGVPTKKTEAVA